MQLHISDNTPSLSGQPFTFISTGTVFCLPDKIIVPKLCMLLVQISKRMRKQWNRQCQHFKAPFFMATICNMTHPPLCIFCTKGNPMVEIRLFFVNLCTPEFPSWTSFNKPKISGWARF